MAETTTEKQKRKKLFVVGAVFVGVFCYLICLRNGAMIFHSNDDASIQDTLSGRYTGSPYPIHQYISVFLSYPIYWLYSLIPTIEWWYIISQFVMLASMSIINCAICLQAERSKYPLSLSLVLVAILDFTYFSYPISNTAYTIVSSFAGASAVVLLFRGYLKQWKYVLSGIFFLLSVFFRYATGIVSLCFVSLGIIAIALDKTPKLTFKAILVVVCVLAAVSCSVVVINKVNNIIQDKKNGPSSE